MRECFAYEAILDRCTSPAVIGIPNIASQPTLDVVQAGHTLDSHSGTSRPNHSDEADKMPLCSSHGH